MLMSSSIQAWSNFWKIFRKLRLNSENADMFVASNGNYSIEILLEFGVINLLD